MKTNPQAPRRSMGGGQRPALDAHNARKVLKPTAVEADVALQGPSVCKPVRDRPRAGRGPGGRDCYGWSLSLSRCSGFLDFFLPFLAAWRPFLWGGPCSRWQPPGTSGDMGGGTWDGPQGRRTEYGNLLLLRRQRVGWEGRVPVASCSARFGHTGIMKTKQKERP